MSFIVFNRNYLIICGLLLLVVNVCQGSHSSIRVDNGYRGVVIALSPEISAGLGNDVVSKTKDLIRAASKALFDATDGYLSFGEVTIVVPNDWADVITDTDIPAHRYSDADIIVVDRESSVQSFSMQFGGCGRHALPIVLTKQLVLGATDNQLMSDARLLVHEWAHYRYGVFNEFGFPSDPLYPPYYSIAGNPSSDEILPNACTGDHKTFNYQTYDMQYGHRCEPRTSNSTGLPDSPETFRCYPIPDADNSFQSSLMYSHYVTNVTKFCSSSKSSHEVHRHNAVAPNKQNILCDGKDVMSVMREHPDFDGHDNRKLAINSSPPEITFKVWRDTKPRTLFAIHNSNNLNTNKRYKIINMALNKFAMDLPDSEMAMFTYNQGDIIKKQNWGSPDKIFPITPNGISLPIDFIKVLTQSQQFFKDGKGGIFVIFISGREIDKSNSKQGVISAAKLLRDNNIKLKIILYPLFDSVDIRKQSSQLFKTAVDITGGQVFHIREELEGDKTSMSTLNQIFKALRTVVSDHSGGGHSPAHHLIKEQLFSNLAQMSEAGQNIKFTFQPDSSLFTTRSKIQLRAYLVQSKSSNNDYYENLIKTSSLKLISPSQDIGTANLFEKTYSLQGFTVTIDSSDKVKGDWTLTADLIKTDPGETLIAIAEFVTTSLDEDVLTAECWLNTQVEFDPSQPNVQPMIAYVNLKKRFDGLISDASVKLIVAFENANYNETIDMLDNGLGDPDITRGDGIYSQYITNIVDIGYHTISAVVTNGPQHTTVTTDFGSTSMPNDHTSKPCCGSKVSGKHDTIDNYFFSRIVECGSVYVSGHLNPNSYPLNTVRDLRIGSVDYDNRKVDIKWTSPEGDHTFDQVGRNDYIRIYDIKAFRGDNDNDHELIQQIKTDFYSSNKLSHFEVWGPSVVSPAPAHGEPKEATVHIMAQEEGFYYIALNVRDSSGQTSRVSNIVMAYIRKG